MRKWRICSWKHRRPEKTSHRELTANSDGKMLTNLWIPSDAGGVILFDVFLQLFNQRDERSGPSGLFGITG